MLFCVLLYIALYFCLLCISFFFEGGGEEEEEKKDSKDSSWSFFFFLVMGEGYEILELKFRKISAPPKRQ